MRQRLREWLRDGEDNPDLRVNTGGFFQSELNQKWFALSEVVTEKGDSWCGRVRCFNILCLNLKYLPLKARRVRLSEWVSSVVYTPRPAPSRRQDYAMARVQLSSI